MYVHNYVHSYVNSYLIKNTSGVTGLAEKHVKSNGRPMPPGFDRLESLVMMNSLQNIVISGAQGLLMLMGSKFLIKMTRLQNTVYYLNVLQPGHLYQKF